MLLFYEHDTGSGELAQVERPSGSIPAYIFSAGLTRRDTTLLEQEFGLAGHLLSDVFDVNELPRLDQDDGTRYVFLRSAELRGDKIHSQPILFATRKDLFVCIATGKQATNGVIDGVLTHQLSPESLQTHSIYAILKQYEALVDKVGTHITEIENRMRSHEVTNEDFYRFVSIESSLSWSRMNLISMRAVVERLMETSKHKADLELLDDARLFASQLLVEIEGHVQLITSVRNAYGTIANNTLNQRMKLLTALTLLLALPNVFYGMYGMNVELPFMHEPWAYFAIVGFTITLMVSIFAIAKRQRFF
jgi:magnesium transporter